MLKKGLNFAPAPRHIPVPEIVAAVEVGLSKVSSTLAQQARTKIAGHLSKARPLPTNLHPKEKKAIQTLRKADSIVIAPADKGNATVVMNRSDYDRKIRTLLTDTDTYKRLPKDPTPAMERRMNGLLQGLTRSGTMSDSLYIWLRSSAGKMPLLYGLPKVHKPEVPLRPIVSFIGSPTYNLSKHLVTILSPLVGRSSSHVRNSFEFASIAGQSLRPGIVLVSFDMVSLFKKVPVELAARVAHERLVADTSLAERTSLSSDEVVNLLRFCLGATYLSYRGEVYQQTFVTLPPVSVTIDNLAMEDVEQRALATCKSHPPIWKRYLDDMLMALPKGQIQKFHQHLNSIECTIQFTIEEESEGALPFLDTWITHHDDGTLSTTVFRKKTHGQVP